MTAQALGVEIDDVESIDCKPASEKWLKEMWPAGHHYEKLEFVVEALKRSGKAMCKWHSTECQVCQPFACDVYIAGFPCAPFSVQRSCRFQDGSHWG